MDNWFQTPFGEFLLKRLPDTDKNLRAWDNADHYLLNYLADKDLLKENKNILIVNDSFGALAVALSGYTRDAYSDSFISHQATRNNIQRNNIRESDIQFIKSTDQLEKQYDLVLIKSVKILALLEEIQVK